MSDDTQNSRRRAELDRAAETLDDMTLAKLRAARKRALTVAEQRRVRTPAWLPLSVAAAAAFVAVALTTLWWRAPDAATVAAEGMEWSLNRDDPDFITDLEFYDWIRTEQDAG